MVHRLLLELLCEEIPVEEQKRFKKEAPAIMEKLLLKERITHSKITCTTTPRRFVIICEEVSETQESIREEICGPPLSIAFKDGEYTKAGLGFAKKCKVEIEDLHKIEKKGKEYLAFWNIEEGKPSIEILSTVLKDFISKLNFKKSMRWGDNSFSFTRPIKGITALFGKFMVKFESHGVLSGRMIQGHRFHNPKAVNLESADKYESLLSSLNVIVDIKKRLQLIKNEINDLAKAEKLDLINDEALFDEVVLLVETPTVVIGKFDPKFLKVPREAILSAMRKHQRYFAFEQNGELAPRFATVLGTKLKDPKVALNGNERVLSARLSDSGFFFEEDCKRTLESHQSHMETMIFHRKLGTIYEKIERIKSLSSYFANLIGADVSLAERAAYLCKMDLDTLMVGEFPELQGLMGQRYAEHQGESPEVSKAIFEHYLPRFSGDILPETSLGIAVALADKLDTITGGIGAGLKPTGSSDPFALRRAALGFFRIILNHNIDISLGDCISKACDILPVQTDSKEIHEFLIDRFRTILLEKAPREMVEAVLSSDKEHPLFIMKKLVSLVEISGSEDFNALLKLFKRMNILKKVEQTPGPVNEALLNHPTEISLFKSVQSVENQMKELMEDHKYSEVLKLLIPLWKFVDDFFDDKKGVRVMDDDIEIQNNRLALLNYLDTLFKKIADFKLMSGMK